MSEKPIGDDPAAEAAEISEVLGMRLGEWELYDKEDGELVEDYVGCWKEQGKSILIRGEDADGFYLQEVSYDPATGIYVENFKFENGDESIRHGRWDRDSKTLRIEEVSARPPLPDGLRVESAMNATGPGEVSVSYTERRGGSEDHAQYVARRAEITPLCFFYENTIGSVDIRFFEGKPVDEAKLRGVVQAAPGTKYIEEVIDSDIRQLFETDLVADARAMAEPVDGKVRLVYEVTMKPTKDNKSDPNASE